MNDGYKTDNFFFSVLLAYTYGMESLLIVDITSRPEFQWDIPSMDAAILLEEWQQDKVTVYAKAFSNAHSALTQKVRDVRQSGSKVYASPAWVAGRGR